MFASFYFAILVRDRATQIHGKRTLTRDTSTKLPKKGGEHLVLDFYLFFELLE